MTRAIYCILISLQNILLSIWIIIFQVDVIVNSVGADLNLQNGIVSKKLVDKAGTTIQDECNAKYKDDGINIGEIAVTNAGKLQCQKIFHVALYTRFVSNGSLSIEVHIFVNFSNIWFFFFSIFSTMSLWRSVSNSKENLQ